LTEAANLASGEMFGTQRLIAATGKIAQDSPLQEYLSTFRNEVNRFCAPALPQDDITLLVLRHRAKSG
jgi:serine phosphatase RsbU (regulator of sigma subunit)